MNSIDVTSSSPGKPVVYIIRHAEASGTAPEDPITPAGASQTEQLGERLGGEHEQLFLVCDTTLERCKQTLEAIEKGFSHDSIKEYINNEYINALEDIVRKVKKILQDSRSEDAIVVCVSDCQINKLAGQLGYENTFRTLMQAMNSDNVVHHLSGLRIGAHGVEAFRFSSCL